MKFGIISSTNQPETCWNAFRFGVTSLKKGNILACGTCLKSRQKEGTNICPISIMKDLLKMVEESDKILTFG